MILSKLKRLFKKDRFECYFDASFSKKKSKGAFYIVNKGTLIKMSVRNINCISSDMAEAEILHGLLEYISQQIPQRSVVSIYGDAKTVIDGATGRCPKSKRYNKLYKKYKALSEQYRLSIEYIPREQNKLADQLSKNKFRDFNRLFYSETGNLESFYQEQLEANDRLIGILQEQLAEKDRQIDKAISALFFMKQPVLQSAYLHNEMRQYKH